MFKSVNVEETSTQQGRKSRKSTHGMMFENSISPDFGCGRLELCRIFGLFLTEIIYTEKSLSYHTWCPRLTSQPGRDQTATRGSHAGLVDVP